MRSVSVDAELDDDYRRLIVECVERGDSLGAYRWAKGWIGSGGGALLLDPWLIYAATSLMRRQPKNAVHSVDLALRSWIVRSKDRAILHWVRAEIVRQWMNDPKSALPDYRMAQEASPAWLAERVAGDVVACAVQASASRKRKPSVGSAPAYELPNTAVAPPNSPPPRDGQQPNLFWLLDPLLTPT